MRILVTGAGGYIGVPLCLQLLERGHAVVGLDRYFFGLDKLEALRHEKEFTILKDDLRWFDPSILTDCDAVIDLAGLSNDATAALDPWLTTDINVHGALRCAAAAKAHGVRRYIYSSSASVYGRAAAPLLTEESPLNPQTAYARSKVTVEQALLSMADSRFAVTALRNSTVYGVAPRMRFDLLLNIATLRAWRDKEIFILGGGEQWRPLIHVADLVEAMAKTLDAPVELVGAQVLNVGSDDQNYQVKEIARLIADIVPGVTVHRPADDPDPRDYNVAFAKLRRVLGWQPSRRVTDGIVEILQALEDGTVRHDDPTCYTLQWYMSIMARTRQLHTPSGWSSAPDMRRSA
jgi:nucleoside-diphosphate-sugar epimerase